MLYDIDDIVKPMTRFNVFNEDSYSNEGNQNNMSKHTLDCTILNKEKYSVKFSDEQELASHLSCLAIK